MRHPKSRVHSYDRAKPKRKVPKTASACVMTPIPPSHAKALLMSMAHKEPGPSRAPTALCMYFDGWGMRRVYRRRRYSDPTGVYEGDHVVELDKRWRKVDISTMTLHEGHHDA